MTKPMWISAFALSAAVVFIVASYLLQSKPILELPALAGQEPVPLFGFAEIKSESPPLQTQMEDARAAGLTGLIVRWNDGMSVEAIATAAQINKQQVLFWTEQYAPANLELYASHAAFTLFNRPIVLTSIDTYTSVNVSTSTYDGILWEGSTRLLQTLPENIDAAKATVDDMRHLRESLLKSQHIWVATISPDEALSSEQLQVQLNYTSASAPDAIVIESWQSMYESLIQMEQNG